MTAQQTWTVNTIKEASRAAGSHWFDPDTMRCFGTKVLPTVYQGPGGIYFVTQDDQYRRELPKRYTVRRFNPTTADIDTVGDVASLDRGDAIARAGELSGLTGTAADFGTSTEEFRPVSVLEQFVADLDAHSSNPASVTSTDAKRMMTHAKRHHRLMELLCSDERFCKEVDEDGNHPQVTDCRARINQCAKRLGATGVLFSGDPRGATVKLTFADGFTNDWGKEGYCVPTEEA